MNQIIFYKNSPNNKYYKLYKLLFFFSIFMLFFFFTNLFIKLYRDYQNELISKKLNSSYSVSTLYNQNNTLDLDIQNYEPFIIGIIKIDKINVNYSILSNSNNELLDISVCRFAGPMPNEIGNLCIAGHNYVDYKFFSRLNELNIGDKINIFDLNGKSVEYNIYKKYEIKPNDISCTSQYTNNKRIITLVTCNNVNGKRLVVQAQENI